MNFLKTESYLLFSKYNFKNFFMYSLTYFQLDRLKSKVQSIIAEHNEESEDKIVPKSDEVNIPLDSSLFWNVVQEDVRAKANEYPVPAAIHEAERLINKRFKTQLEEMLRFAVQCSEALEYYSSLQYKPMFYRLMHTTPLHWVRQIFKWISSQELKSIKQEEMEKAEELESLLDEVCTRIGEMNRMLHLFEKVSSLDMTVKAVVKLGQRMNNSFIKDNYLQCETVADACAIIDRYEEVHATWIQEKKRQLSECHVPNYFSRHWLYYSSVAIVGVCSVRYLNHHYDTLQPLVSQGWSIIVTNINQRLIVPMKETYNILRFNNKLSGIDAQKLEEGKKNLSEMIKNYLIDIKSTDNLELYIQKAYDGDISPAMENYVKNIRHPLLNLFSTSLTTELLIQLQSLQLDMLKVMSNVGDVMQSNALNVELMALMPVVILFSSIFLSVSFYQRSQDHSIHNLIQTHLFEMDKIMNSNLNNKKLSAKDLGKVFYHSSCCIRYSQIIMDQIQQKSLFSDISELNYLEWSSQQKYNVINRLYKYIDFTRS